MRQVVEVDVENKKVVAQSLRKTHELTDDLNKQLDDNKKVYEKVSIFPRATSPTYLKEGLKAIIEHDENHLSASSPKINNQKRVSIY